MNKTLLKNIFQDRKLRRSHPRILVYQELSDAGAPLSPQQLYRDLLKKERKVGLTSIYRSLDVFESLGMVFKIRNGSSVKYKLCETKDHHHHIVCKACGNVMELNFCDISDLSRKVSDSTGYLVTDHQLDFYGLCKDCKMKT